MDPKITTARLQDLNEGLFRKLGGTTEYYFRKTKRLGAAIRICNLIKGREVIDRYDMLCAATGELGIPVDIWTRAEWKALDNVRYSYHWYGRCL